MSIGDLFPPEGMQSEPSSMFVGGNAVPVTRSSLEELQSVVEGEDVYNDYKKLKELTDIISLEENAVNTGKKTPDDLKSLRLQMNNLQDFILGKYGSRDRFQTLLVNAFPSVVPEVLAKDDGILSLEYPAEDNVARATAYGSSGGIGAYAAEQKEGSVSPVAMPQVPRSRLQARSPRPIRAPGGAQLNNTDYLAVPEYMQRPDYFDFNPSAGADFTQQLLARAAEEKAGGFSNLV